MRLPTRPRPGPRPAHGGRRRPAAATRPAATAAGGDRTAAALVDALIAATAGTDRGASATDEERARIDADFDTLAALTPAPRPFDDARLWGDCDVAWVSSGSRQAGQPAGGAFRGPARALFRTTLVAQGLYAPLTPGAPPAAVNLVAFRLAGALPGHVALAGDVAPEADGVTARVDFSPPVLVLLPQSSFFRTGLRIGPPSWVRLATPYVDGSVRLGVGSLGSRFLFVRREGGPDLRAAAAATTALGGWLALAAAVAALALRAPAAARPLALVPFTLAALIARCVAVDRWIMWRGPAALERQAPRQKKEK